jgi:hypothetical protein
VNYYGILESGFVMRLGRHNGPLAAERAALKKFGHVTHIINERQAMTLLGSLYVKLKGNTVASPQ